MMLKSSQLNTFIATLTVAVATTLTVPMDLANILTLDQGKAWLGFTADSGGAAWENHDLISWSYKDEITASEEPKSVPESSLVFGLLAFSAISAGSRLLHQGQQKS